MGSGHTADVVLPPPAGLGAVKCERVKRQDCAAVSVRPFSKGAIYALDLPSPNSIGSTTSSPGCSAGWAKSHGVRSAAAQRHGLEWLVVYESIDLSFFRMIFF